MGPIQKHIRSDPRELNFKTVKRDQAVERERERPLRETYYHRACFAPVLAVGAWQLSSILANLPLHQKVPRQKS